MTETKIKLPPLKHQGNSPYFDQQPSGTRPAIWEDFTDTNGKIILNKPYLIKSEATPGRFWAFRTKPGFTTKNDFWLFLAI